MKELKLLDTVTNLQPIPVEQLILVEPEYQSIQNLPSGQIGTIVELYEAEQPKYLVEFADSQGREYAMAILQTDEILALHYELTVA
jgi:hypothetical protein